MTDEDIIELAPVQTASGTEWADLTDELRGRLGPGPFPGLRRPLKSTWWCLHISFGALCIILALAILAAVPGLNVLALGYLVEPQRRVALSGRLRDGFPLLVLAPRLGIMLICVLIFQLPLRFQGTRVSDAMVLLGPDHPRTQLMATTLTTLQWLIGTHLVLAILNGSTLGCYLRPVRNLRRSLRLLLTTDGRRELAAGIDLVLSILQPVQHFLAGLRAFFGAAVWLIIPTSLLVAYSPPDRVKPVFGLLAAIGVVLMIPVVAWLPFLQVQQIVAGRFKAVLAVREVRRRIRTAPLAWMFSTTLLCLMTLPLYLGKVRLPPADALLVLTPIFVVLIYPARLAVAWAWHRGGRSQPARWLLHVAARLIMIPILAVYAIFLLLTPAISELGRNAPFENQAFLGPAPVAQWGSPRQQSPPPGQPQQNQKNSAGKDHGQQQQRPDQTGPDPE
ncbi:MAG: hypothetical protein RLZZ436_1956 [Planctomycetota bacterium]|jgi:hypothetical protein